MSVDSFAQSSSSYGTSPFVFDISCGQAELPAFDPTSVRIIDGDKQPVRPTIRNSCMTCRKRKVKCDKRMPCSNCVRARIPCVFPGLNRAPRRRKNAPTATKDKAIADNGSEDVLSRINHLEDLIKKLSENKSSGAAGAGRHDDHIADSHPGQHDNGTSDGQRPALEERSPSNEIEREFGRLVIGQDGKKSRYGSSSLWAHLSQQVEDIKEILQESSSDEEDHYEEEDVEIQYDPSTEHGQPLSSTISQTTHHRHHHHHHHRHHEFLFGYSSVAVDLRPLHPPPEQLLFYWEAYKDSVDPVVKVAHVPTTEKAIMKIIREKNGNFEGVSRGFEALMFAIYLAVVTSFTADQCRERLKMDRSMLLDRYRFGAEQALAKADFLNTHELVVMQAFVTFLVRSSRE